jgi:O-antigen/teichoic acid export membrane protein
MRECRRAADAPGFIVFRNFAASGSNIGSRSNAIEHRPVSPEPEGMMRGLRQKLAGLMASLAGGGAVDGAGFPGKVTSRIASGTALIVGSYFVSQMLRLAGNLVLSRILFPEAFGLMTLVMVVIVGVTMFSDVGIKPSIQQSKRGDDQDFLDTAWTIQLIRCLLLWIACCLLAWPASAFFNEPMLAKLIPVASFFLVIHGFFPTRIDTADRHMMLGRVTVLDLASQVIALLAMILLAWITRSVWALPIGTIVGAVARLVLSDRYLLGPRNRLRWEREARIELIRFGKWIFLSTAFSFLLSQSDKMILGKYVSIEGIGIYNVGFFIATAPMMIAIAVNGRMMLPLCRDHPPGQSRDDFRIIRKVRFRFTLAFLACQVGLAFLGGMIIQILYDDRFLASGAIVVAVALMNLPYLIGMTYDVAALAAGDSRSVFMLNATRAVLQAGLFLAGIELDGLTGAFIGFALGHCLAHALVIRVAIKHKAWDPLHDAVMVLIGLIVAPVAIWLHLGELAMLSGFVL